MFEAQLVCFADGKFRVTLAKTLAKNSPAPGSAGPRLLDKAFQDEVASVRAPWVGSAYYDDAELWTHLFWHPRSLYRQLFDKLDHGDVIELASGYGRHAEQAAALVKRLRLVDVIEDNLDKCRARLGHLPHVSFHLGDGASFPDVADANVDSIYSYDSMVHFSPRIVRNYLQDAARVLRPGGRGLFHHSNYASTAKRSWRENPHARNLMKADLFAHYARAAGLKVVEQHIVEWGGNPGLDCISLVERP